MALTLGFSLRAFLIAGTQDVFASFPNLLWKVFLYADSWAFVDLSTNSPNSVAIRPARDRFLLSAFYLACVNTTEPHEATVEAYTLRDLCYIFLTTLIFLFVKSKKQKIPSSWVKVLLHYFAFLDCSFSHRSTVSTSEWANSRDVFISSLTSLSSWLILACDSANSASSLWFSFSPPSTLLSRFSILSRMELHSLRELWCFHYSLLVCPV